MVYYRHAINVVTVCLTYRFSNFACQIFLMQRRSCRPVSVEVKTDRRYVRRWFTIEQKCHFEPCSFWCFGCVYGAVEFKPQTINDGWSAQCWTVNVWSEVCYRNAVMEFSISTYRNILLNCFAIWFLYQLKRSGYLTSNPQQMDDGILVVCDESVTAQRLHSPHVDHIAP